MKKTIIVFILAAFVFVFGSCEVQKGGTIKIVNNDSDYDVHVYITKDVSLELTSPPTSGVVANKIIAKGATGEISIGEDGTYYVKPFYTYIDAGSLNVTLIGTMEPAMGIAILALGNSVTVKVKRSL